VVAFLDFRKAFDTISRPFLFAVMEAVMGPGAGMVAWARTLLGATRASAMVNGFESRPAASAAGVRQGCPLSPALYLFIALALSAWLRAQPADTVGVDLGPAAGGRLCGTQFADDANILLPGLGAAGVQRFLGAMAVFARASGQALNAAKSKLLPVGDWPAGEAFPAAVCGLPVVAQAEALGMQFSNQPGDAAAAVDWPARLDRVRGCYGRLAALPLSIFGRASAASGYGVAQLLYHAEFAGLPADTAAQLQRMTTKLVDRGLGPASQEQGLPGVPSRLLPGRPALGGFGALAWPEHVVARHVSWTRRALVFLGGVPPSVLVRQRRQAPEEEGEEDADGEEALALPVAPPPPMPLWVPLARALLARLCPATPPALALLSAAGAQHAGRLAPSAAGLDGVFGPALPPGPLRRMADGLRALGRVVVCDEPALGDWCWEAPLWCNPVLRLEEPRPELQAQWQLRFPPGRLHGLPYHAPMYWAANGFARLAPLGLRCLRTAGDLCGALKRFCAWKAARRAAGARLSGQAAALSLLTAVWGARPGDVPAGLADVAADTETFEAALLGMWQALPQPWRAALEAAHAARGAAPAAAVPGMALPAASVCPLLQAVGWAVPQPPGVEPPPPPARPASVGVVSAGFSVRAATQLQLGGVLVERHACHAAHVQAALGAAADDAAVAAGLQQLRGALRAAWRLDWENVQKELLWRLTVGGVPAAGGHGICPGVPCVCGWAPPADLPAAQRAAALQHHAFWAAPGAPGACPISAAVVGQLRLALPAEASLTCADLWLLRPPEGGRVHAGVWRVVGLAALSAMAHGRRCAWRFRCEALEARDADGRRQATLDELWGAAVRRMAREGEDEPALAQVPPPGPPPPPPAALLAPAAPAAPGLGVGTPPGAAAAPLAAAAAGPAAAAAPRRGNPAAGQRVRPEQRAARRAAADLWCRLGDFVALGSVPPDWEVAPDAPFLAAAAAAPDGAGPRLVLNVPAAAGAAGA
jgi:hypothetical protein